MDIYTLITLSQLTQGICAVIVATYVVKVVRHLRSK